MKVRKGILHGNFDDIYSVLDKKKAKKEHYLQKVVRYGNSITILVSGKEKKNKYFALCVYDLNKKKMVRNTIMPFVESKAVDAAYRINYKSFEIDEKYVYVMNCSGKCIRSNKKVYDQRRRSVYVYDYSGKYVNSIDFTKYISKYKTTPGRRFLDSVESEFDVKDGDIYFPSRKGIFKCKATGKKIKKLFDATDSELSNKAKRVTQFVYTGKGKCAFIMARDYQDCYLNVMNIK